MPAHRLLDRRALRRHHARASGSFDDAAVLQARVREELLARLDWVKVSPAVVLDLGCATGHGAQALARRYPGARVLAMDAVPAMLAEAGRHATDPGIARVCADAEWLPLPESSVDLVFAAFLLPWCEDLDGVFAEVARVLRPRGLVTFATVGPDTLVELRAAWAEVDDHAHVHPFTDMHDIGDGLVRAGLVEPVLDVSRYTLTYADLDGLVRDLRATGSQNAATARPRGLTGRGRRRALEQAYEPFRREGVLPATVEVVFGQAWGALESRRPDGEFAYPVERIGRRG